MQTTVARNAESHNLAMVRDTQLPTICVAALSFLLAVTTSAYAQKADALDESDPYILKFSDFGWNLADSANGSEKALAGAVPLGNRMPLSKAIAIYEKQVELDSQDAASRILLGDLYLEYAKQNDALPFYGKSESVLREAIELDPDSNSAKLILASTLAASHHFRESLSLADSILLSVPASADAMALRFDALLELGKYDAARTQLTQLLNKSQQPAVVARQARMLELDGELSNAIQLLQRSISESDAVLGTWYHWRLGNLQLTAGNIQEATDCFEHALEQTSDDGPSLVGLARCQFAGGNESAALRTMERAVDLHSEPPMVALLGDLLEHLGEQTRAEKCWDQAGELMRAEATVAGDAHARELALFYADHDRNLEEALRVAERDLARRSDIYAHDTLAWCQFKNGKIEQASANMAKAMSLGTKDPNLYFHAWKIYEVAGKADMAKKYRQELLKLKQSSSIKYATHLNREY